MSLTMCNNCGCLLDSDEHPEIYITTDENGDETEQDYPECDSCKYGTY